MIWIFVCLFFSLRNMNLFSVRIFQYLEEKHEFVLKCWEMKFVLDRWSIKWVIVAKPV